MTKNSLTQLRLRLIVCQVLLALAVATAAHAQPAFTKSFTPTPIGPGSVSTLTFTIDNTLGVVGVTALAFTDVLPAAPAQMLISTPARATTDCINANLGALDGGTTITFSNGTLAPGAVCTVSVDVTATTPGTYTNAPVTLTWSVGSVDSVAADLVVDAVRPGFTKSFTPSTISLGASSTLTLSVTNTNPAPPALAGMAFTDNLPAGMVVANPANASTTCGGALVATPGTSVISFSGGNLAAASTCSVTVDVITTTVGTFVNVTGVVTAFSGFSFISGGFAVATLDVPIEFLSKVFTDDPVPPGGTVTLEFVVTNPDRNFSATNVSFTDDLDATLSGLAVTGALPNTPCGAGSTLTGTNFLTLSGGTLAPAASCTFSVTLQVPAMAVPGTYPNTTSAATADINGVPFNGNAATDDLLVSPVPTLTKTFTDDPVAPGGTVTLEFTITNTSTTSSATGITFTDDLGAMLSGLTVAMLPAAGFCGAGSTITDVGYPDILLSMTNGDLAAGASCTFDVVLLLPAGAPSGTFVNTTSMITATVGATRETGNAATDNLVVLGGPTLVKSFTDDPVPPGGTVTLEFTLSLDAASPTDATGITFTDNLNGVLTGLAATGLPMNDVCGMGSSISGTTSLTFAGGTLSPGTFCTFSVSVDVPAGAAPGNHLNTTSPVMATVGGLGVTENPTSDILMVTGLSLTKSYTDDPVFPGGMVTLEFVLTNSSTASGVTDITFSDPVDNTLPGLAVVGSPLIVNDLCGLGSTLVGVGGTLSFGGGILGVAPGVDSSCTFSVTLQVPAGAAPALYGNATSTVVAVVGVTPVIVPGAGDDLLVVDPLTISKSFTNDPVLPGGTVTLQFTVTNAAAQAATNIAFTDDLDAVLTGLAAVDTPKFNVCGVGSIISGGGVLTLAGGTLPPAGFCTFSVTLLVPAGAPSGIVINTTGTVTGDLGMAMVTGGTATDNLTVLASIPLPGFSKSFAPNFIGAGTVSTLTFTIDNTASGVAIPGLDFTDNLPAGMTFATPANASTNCSGGVLTATSGTGVVSYTGGSAPASDTCTVQVNVIGVAAGTHLNTTGNLTSVAGDSGAAGATLTVRASLLFVPTLSTWGFVLFAGLLALVALWKLRLR